MQDHTYLGEIQSGYGTVPLSLTREQRFEHLAAIGATGVGKSSLLRTLACSDIERGDGILFIDCHGDDATALLDRIPAWRHNQVAYLHPASDHVVALNVLECDHANDRARVADAIVTAVRDIWFADGGLSTAPRMENLFRHAVLALLHVPDATLPLVGRLITDDVFRLQVVPRVTNPITRAFFEDRFAEWRDAFRAEVVEPLMTRLDTVLTFPEILCCLGQYKDTLRIERAMQGRRIIIANLSGMSETAMHLMGALLMARVRAATMARSRIPASDRVPFYVFADEVSKYASNSLPVLLSEARKFAVSISYSTQMLAQLSEKARAGLLSTTGTLAAFRCGPDDAAAIGAKFHGLHREFNVAALNELDRGEAMIKVGADDVRRVLCPAPVMGLGTAEVVRRQSSRHYAQPRVKVEKWLQKAMAVPAANLEEVHMIVGRRKKRKR